MSSPATMAASDRNDAHDAQRAPPPTFHDGSLSHDVTAVKLTCGQTFTVHTDLLCYWSPTLRTMLEDKTQELKLDLDVKIFRVVLHWLYTKQLRGLWDHHMSCDTEIISVEGNEEIQDPESYYRQQPEYYALEVYMFATTYDIKALRNEIVKELFFHCPSDVASYVVVLRAYKQLPPTSLLLTYFSDMYAKYYTGDLDRTIPSELILRKQLPNSFLVPWLLTVTSKKFEKKELDVDDYLEPV